MRKSSMLLRQLDTEPYALEKLVALFWNHSLEGMDQFVETDQVGGVGVEYVEDEVGLVVGYVDFEIADDLFELI